MIAGTDIEQGERLFLHADGKVYPWPDPPIRPVTAREDIGHGDGVLVYNGICTKVIRFGEVPPGAEVAASTGDFKAGQVVFHHRAKGWIQL